MIFSVLLLAGITGLSINVAAQPQGGFVPSRDNPDEVYSIALQADGKILVAQSQTVKRLNPDGTTDTAFTAPHNLFLNLADLTVQPDGKILCSAFGGHGLVRLNTNGTIDNSFNAQIDLTVSHILTEASGKIYISGKFTTVGGLPRKNIARLNSDGSVDATFASVFLTGGDDDIPNIVLQPDGKILVAASFTTVNGSARSAVTRLNVDGSLDDSFVPPVLVDPSPFPQVVVYSVSRQGDGKVIIGGHFTFIIDQQTFTNILRLNSNGSADPTFALAAADMPVQPILATSVQSDGKILVGGASKRFAPFGADDYQRNLVDRFNPDGSRDNSVRDIPISLGQLGPPLSGPPSLWPRPFVWSLAVQPDGKILAAGRFDSPINGFARIDTDGRLDVPFARFDFDGDKRADLAVFRPSNNTWYIRGANSYRTYQFGVATDLPAPADYDGDGKTDIAVFRQSNGTWYWINSATESFSYQQWGEPGDLPVPGTRYAVRTASFDVYRPSNGTWYRLASANGSYYTQDTVYGNPGDVPVLASYSGIFRTDIAVYRSAITNFLHRYWEFWGGGNQVFDPWGLPGSIPLSGDFDGDYKTDLAVYEPSIGRWHVKLSSNGSSMIRNWGEPGDIPVPADYDGDGFDDVAVFRPSTGQWYLWQSTEGISVQQFGQAGDVPIPSSYQYGH